MQGNNQYFWADRTNTLGAVGATAVPDPAYTTAPTKDLTALAERLRTCANGVGKIADRARSLSARIYGSDAPVPGHGKIGGGDSPVPSGVQAEINIALASLEREILAGIDAIERLERLA